MGLPDGFYKQLRSDRKLRDAWEGKLQPEGQVNQIGYSCMFASMLYKRGFSKPDVIKILREYPSAGDVKDQNIETISTIIELAKEPPKSHNSPADYLADIAEERSDLYIDQLGRKFVRVLVGDHFELFALEDRKCKEWISLLAYESGIHGIRSDTKNSIVELLNGKANQVGKKREFHNRVGFYDGSIWYDLTDDKFRAINISTQGWKIVDEPPPMFYRYSHQRPQPVPNQMGRDLRLQA